MSKHFTAAQLAELVRKAEAYDRLCLADFSHTLERVLEEKLAFLGEPVFTNPTSGKKASSWFAISDVFDGVLKRADWPKLGRMSRSGDPACFSRDDFEKTSKWPTPCVDLDAVERLLTTIRPRKGKKVLAAFKVEHGCSN